MRATKPHLIKLIQIAKRQLNMDDATYRSILREIGNADSSTKMSVSNLELVLEHMKKCGFEVVPNKKRTGSIRLASDAQSRMIRGLWLELYQLGAVRDPSEYALTRYVKRITGNDLLQWTSGEDKSQVIETLKKWLDRIGEQNERKQ